MVDEGATKPPCNDAGNAFGGRASILMTKDSGKTGAS